MPKNFIGVDLGGTKIAAGLLNQEGEILDRLQVLTNAAEGPSAVVGRIIEVIRKIMSRSGLGREDVMGIGIGAPGPLNVRTGVVISPPNLHGWHNVPLKDLVEQKVGVPTFIDNDANVAALAEHRLGAGRGTREMIYITVSTGIGGGIIINGELYHGFSDIAGEVGHITIDVDGPLCSCGNAGCLEELSSGRAVARTAREALAKGGPSLMRELCGGDIQLVSPELVGEAAVQSDPMALAVVEQIGTYLGIGVASLVNILNPQRVVIGGGVSKIGTPLFQVVRRTVRERAVSSCADVVEIVPAELGDDVGIIGAAILVKGSLET